MRLSVMLWRNFCGWFFPGLLLLASVGCRLPQSIPVTLNSAGVPHYDKLRLMYVVDGTTRAVPLNLAEMSQFGEEETPVNVAESVKRPWERASLIVQYPHPSGSTKMARASLRLTHRSNTSLRLPSSVFGQGLLSQEFSHLLRVTSRPELSPPEDEVWTLDISRKQLDTLLVNLTQNGFFDAQERSDSGTALDLQIDTSHVRKTWAAEPPLERLLTKVYREGNASSRTGPIPGKKVWWL
ncbi:MAG: hypothetical protein U0903_15715 [Planctomycetales bacterium]